MSNADPIEYHGRWSPEHATACAGASFHFRTASPSVVLRLGWQSSPGGYIPSMSQPSIAWAVDGEDAGHAVAEKGKEIVLRAADEAAVAEEEKEKEFDVIVTDYGATVQVQDIKIADNYVILPPKLAEKPALRLLFIGDSLTSGFSPMYLGAYGAYPTVFSRSLRSKGHNVHTSVFAYPGINLVSSRSRWGGGEDGIDERIYKGWETGLNPWSDEQAMPNVIFICIGTNDQGMMMNEKAFLKVFRPWIDGLRSKTGPSLDHIVVISPFGFFRSGRTAIYEPAVQNMVQDLAKEWADNAYEAKLWHVDTDGWISRKQCADGVHPNEEGHELIAARLEKWVAGNLLN